MTARPAPPRLFDRRRARANLRRARAGGGVPALRGAPGRLAARLGEVRGPFARALALGDRDGSLARALSASGRVGEVVAAAPAAAPGAHVVADEEAVPFADGSFDLVASATGLHLANDLPGALVQLRRALRPEGLLLASLPAGGTLRELRESLLEAEAAVAGTATRRVAPFADVRALGDLLARAGFAFPVADADAFRESFADLPALARALRAEGEGNALADRSRRPVAPAILAAASALYRERHGDGAGGIAATFEIVTLTGTAPAAQGAAPRSS